MKAAQLKTGLRAVTGLLITVAATIGISGAHAQEFFPNKPVRMIVAFPAGGGTDIVARVIAERLGNIWGQQVIVDNRVGAGGVIGTTAAARAAPDGYTIFMATLGNLSINPHLYKMPVQPVSDFAPISNVVDVQFILVAHPSVPARDVKELIALARSKPGGITYASSGVGGAPHLAGELFNEMNNVRLAHIPYKGSGPSFTDLVGGQVSLTFDSMVQALPYIQADKLRPLAVLSNKRSPLLPQVPTMEEAGVAGYNFSNWFGLVAPVGTPPAVIQKLNVDVRKVLEQPAVRMQLERMGALPAATSSQQFGQLIVTESQKWEQIIKKQNIRAE